MTPKTAREHLRDVRIIWARWAVIGFVACFWVFVAQHWDTVVGWFYL